MSVPWFRLLGYLFFVLFFINVLTESYGLSNNQFKSASNTSNLLITNDINKILNEIGQKAETILGFEYEELETWLWSHYGTFKRHRRTPSQTPDRHSESSVITPGLRDVELLPLAAQSVKLNGTVKDIKAVKTSDVTYVIVTEQAVTGSAHVLTWNKYSKTLSRVGGEFVPGAAGVEAFTIGRDLYFIVVVNPKEDFYDPMIRSSELYRIDPSSKILPLQTFLTVSATKWKSFSLDGRTYLAQASLLKYSGVMKNATVCEATKLKGSKSVIIHEWIGKGFKKVLTIAASYPVDMEWCQAGTRFFLVIANSRFDKHAGSVYVYEVTPSEQAPNINFNLFQMLPVSAPSDVHCVYSKNSLFLAVADSYFQVAGRRYYNADSILYRFNGLFFVEYQKIPALGAWKWNSVELNTGDGILTLLSSEDLRAFGHDEFSWYPISIEPKNGLLGVADVGNGYWVAGQTTAEHSTISVYFWHANRTDLVTNVQLADVCAVLKSKQDWASFHISALESEVVVTSSGHGSGILKESMTYSSPLPMLRKMASFLDGEISHLNRIILESRRRRPGVTLLVTDDLVTHRLTVGMASTNTIHNVDFLKFVDSALKIIPESHNLIPPQYRFSKAHFQGAAVVKGMVNGLSLPTDFAHLHRSNTFAERLRAETLLVRRLEVGGRLDDVVITNVLLTKGNQQVSSGLSLDTDLEMENLDIASGVVDTWNWTALVSDAIYLDSGGTISKDVEFESDVTTKAGLNIGHLVKTMNLANFFRFAMRTDSPQSIPAMIEWLDVELQRDMIVSSSLINEFNLEDFVLVRNPKWHSARLFLPTVVAGSLEVVGEINGLKLKDDILTTEGHQIIKGRKHFTSLEVVHKSMSGNETIVRLKTLRLQGLRLMGRMNPNILDMTTISDNLYCRTATFHSGVTFDKLSIAPAVFGDLMPASSSQPLSLGRLSFSEVVFLNDVAVGGSVGNLDILRLVSSTLKTVGDDVVAAQLTFLDSIETSAELDVVRLKTEGKYDLSNDGVAGLSLKVWTGSVVAPSLTTELANVGGMVADVDVNLLFWDTLLIHGEQRVKGTKIIAGDMRVDIPNLMVMGGTWIDGKDWQHLLREAQLSNSRYLIIESDVEFLTPLNVQSLHAEVIDGVRLKKLFSNVLTYNESRPVVWSSSLDAWTLHAFALNGVYLNQYFSEVIALGMAPLPVSVRFEALLVHKMIVTGTIDGLRVADIVCHSDENVVIRAPKWFRHNVRIVGDLHSANEISDFNGRSLVTTLDTDRLIFQGNLIVTGLIDDISWESIRNAVKLFPNSVAVLRGHYHFEDLHLDGDIFLNGKLNRTNLTELSVTMVTIDTSQTLTGTYSFASEVYFLKDMAMRNITINESATIESKDLHWWASHEESLRLWEEKPRFHGPATIEGHLIVHGTVNGVDLWSLVVMEPGPRAYFGSEVTKLTTLRVGDIKTQGKIMGVNVLLWSTQAVTLDMTNVTVMGPKLFNHLEVVKTECAVFLKELASCLSRSMASPMEGHATFIGNVTVDGKLTLPESDSWRMNLTDADLCMITSNLSTVLRGHPKRPEDFVLKFAHPGLTCKVHEPSSGHIVLLKYLGGGRYDVLIDDDKFSELVVHQKIGTCDAFEEAKGLVLILSPPTPGKTAIWTPLEGIVTTVDTNIQDMTKITSAACAGVWFLEPVEHGFLIFKWSDELQKPLLVQKLDAPHGVMAKFWEGKIVMASRYGHSTVIELLTCHEEKFMPKDHTVLEHFNFKDLASCATAIFVLSTHKLLALKFGTRLEVVNEMEVAHPSHVTCFSRGDIEFVTLTMLHKSVLYDSGLTKIGEIATGEPLAIEEWDHDYVMIVKEHVKCEGPALCPPGLVKIFKLELGNVSLCGKACEGPDCRTKMAPVIKTPCDKTRAFGCMRKTSLMPEEVKTSVGLPTAALPPSKTSKASKMQKTTSASALSSRLLERVSDGSRSQKLVTKPHVEMTDVNTTLPSWEDATRDVKTSVDFVPVSHTGVGMRKSTTKSSTESAYSSDVLDRNITTSLTKATEHAEELTAATYLEHGQRKMSTVTWEFEKETPERKVISMAQTATSSTSDEDMDSSSTTTEVSSKSPVDGSSGSTIKIDVATLAGVGTSTASVVAEGMKWMAASTPALSTSLATPVSAEILASTDYTRKEYTSRIQMEVTGSSEVSGMASTENKTTLSTGLTEIVTSELPEMLTASTAHWQSSIDTLETVSMASSENPTVKHFAVVAEDESTISGVVTVEKSVLEGDKTTLTTDTSKDVTEDVASISTAPSATRAWDDMAKVTSTSVSRTDVERMTASESGTMSTPTEVAAELSSASTTEADLLTKVVALDSSTEEGFSSSTRADVAGGSSSVLTTLTLKDDKPLTLSSTVTEVMESPEGSSTTSIPEVIPAELLTASTSEVKDVKVVAQSTLSTLVEETSTRVAEKLSSTTTTPDIMEVLGVSTSTVTSESPDSYAESILSSALTEVDELLKLSTTTMVPELTTPEQETSKSTLTSHHSVRQSLASTSTEVHHVPERTSLLWTPGTSTETSLELLTEETPSTTEGTMVDATMDTRETTTIVGGSDKTTEKEWVSSSETSLELDTRSEAEQSLTSVGLTVEELAVITGQETTTVTGLNLTRPSSISTTETIDVMGSKLAVTSTEVGKTEVHTRAGSVAMTGTSSMGEADDVAQTLSTSSLPERESRMDYTTESTVTSSYSQIDMEESIGSTFTPEVKPETFPSTSTEKTEVTTISKTPATSTTSFTVVPEDFPEKYSSVLVSDVETVATSTASTEAIKLDLELETTVSSPSTDVSVREDVEVVTTSTIPTLTRTLAHSTTLTESSELPVWSEESSTEHTEMVTSETTKILTETTTIIASSEGKMDLDTSTSSEVGLETKEYEAFSPLVSTSVEVLKTSSVSMDTSLATTPDVADTERTSTKIPTIMDIVLETGSSTTFSPVIEEKLPSVTFPQTETSPVLDVEKLTSSTTLPEMQLEVLNASTHTVFGATITDELASELMSTSVAGSTLEEVAPTQFGPTLTTTPEGSLDTSSITTGVLTEETEIGDIEDFASSSTVTEATERLAWSTITWIPEVVKEDLGSTSTERILETTKTSEGSSTTSQLEDIELTRPTSTSPYAEGLTEALEESSLASSTSADIERPESTSLSTRLVSTATTEVPTFSSTTLLEELTKKLASVSTTTELTETSGTSAGSTSTETFLDVAVEKRASTSTMKQTVTTKMVEDFTSTSVVPEETTTETSTFASSVAELSMVEEMEMSTVTLTPDVVKLEEISTSTEVPLTTEGSERATLTSTSETITERVVTTSTQGLTEDTTSSLEFSSSTTILEGRTEEELTALSTVVSTSSATEMSQSSTSSTPLKDTSLTEKTSTSTPETITTSKISEGSSPSTTFSEDYVTEEISSTFSPSETAEGHKTMTTTTPLILEGATELPGMSTSTITLQTTYHELSSSTVAFETTPVKEVFSETSAHSITSEMPTEVSTGSTPEHVSGEEEAISISQSTISTPSSPDAKTRWALTSTTPEVVDKILVSSTSRMSEIPEISDAPTTKTTSEDLVHSEPRSMTSSTTEDLEHVADEQLTTASTLSEELVTVVPDASTGTTGIFKGSSGEEFGLSSTTSSVQTTKGVELSSVTTDIPEETGDTDVISLSTLTTKVAPTTLHLSTMSTTADETKFSSPKHSESTTERVTEAIVLDQTTTTRILVTLSDVKETVFMPSTESSSEMEVTMATSEASSVSTTPREDLVTETPSSSTVREGQEEALDVSSSSTILDDVDTESQLSEGTTDSTTPAEPFVFKETESTSVTEMTDTVIKSSWSTSTLAQLEHKDVEHLSSPTDTVTSVTTLPSKTETPEYTESFEKEILVDHSVATYSTEVTTSPTASHSTTVYDEVPSVDDYSRPTSTSRPTTDLEDDFSSSSTTSDLSTFATESSIASTLLWTPESAETLPETSTTNYSATTMSELEVSLLTTTATDSDWIEDKVSTSTEASLVHLASAAVRETSESVSDTTVLSPELSSIGTAYETASTSPRLPSSHGSSTPLVDSTDELPSATMTTETVPEEHVDAVTSTTALPPAKEITDDLSTAASMMSTEQTVIAESTFSTIHDLLQEAVAESVGETTVGTTEDGIAKCE